MSKTTYKILLAVTSVAVVILFVQNVKLRRSLSFEAGFSATQAKLAGLH